ncbi:MAG: hypothetical protein ACJA01_001979 [Saprospiraceae bacterium]|jgi:hypothetical protein
MKTKRLKMSLRSISIGVAILLLLASCNVDPSKITVKPKALGVMNDILVVADADIWESVIGDTIQDIFGGYYPITHRPEPIFDLRYFTAEEINQEPLRKQLRTYMIVANLADENSAATKMVKEDLGNERFNRGLTDSTFNTSVGKDKWANGQIVIYVFANSINALSKAIVDNFDGISSRVNEHDLIQLNQTTYARGENLGLAAVLKERFGADIIIPTDYKTVLDSLEQDKMMWFRKETKTGTMNVVLREYDYSGPELLTEASAKKRFDLFGINVSSAQPETYIIINNVDLPLLTFDRSINGNYTKEYRGIWEMENDFFGGSYQGYAIVNESTSKMLVMDAFVHAPGQRKRDMMQQLDRIAKRIKW